jgi:signal transduction histidine kinase
MQRSRGNEVDQAREKRKNPAPSVRPVTVALTTALSIATTVIAICAMVLGGGVAAWVAAACCGVTAVPAAWLTARQLREADAVPAPALVQAREAERGRLHRDVHDGLGPGLAALRLRLDSAATRLGHDPQARQIVLDAAAETGWLMDEVRRIVDDARPLDLEHTDLLAALSRMVERLSSSGLYIAAELPTGPVRLSAATEIAAYRIAGECLTNAVRHAGASEIRLRLTAQDERLVMEISDDGIGMTQPAGRAGGVGLSSITSRAEEVGGRCAVLARTDVPSGTVVRTVLPRFVR